MSVRFEYRRLLSSAIIAILLVSFFLTPSLNLIPPANGTSEDWWNASWPYRKTITINQAKVGGILESFPLLTNVIHSDLAKAQQDGDDIVFVDTNTGIKLNHEIEYFNRDTGHLVAWVSVPLLTNTTDTKLYMYYGNPSAGNQQTPAAVWDSSFKMVLHLDEKTGMHYDSTLNGNNGTPYGGTAQGVTGKIDGADNFDGINDYIEVPHNNSIAGFTTAFTASFWLKLEDNTRRQTLLNKYNTLNNQRAWFIEYQNHPKYGKVLGFFVSQDGFTYYEYYTSLNPTAGEWYYIAIVWETDKVPKFYVNGIQVSTIGTATVSSIFNNIGAPLHIGRSTYATDRYLKGALDEIRLSDIGRLSDWFLTSFNNQKDPSAFYAIGEEERLSDLPPFISDEKPPDGATDVYTNPTLSIQVTDIDGDPITVIFSTNATGIWQDIGSYINVNDGTYTWIPATMNKLGTKYYWTASVTDGESWINKTYSFTTTTIVLKNKWTVWGEFVPSSISGVLIADVDGDGLEEVFHAGDGGAVALRGTDGSVIWNVSLNDISTNAQAQMADLNGDGILEIIIPEKHGVHVLHANNGSTCWRTNLSGSVHSSPVVADIHGTGYPIIFIVSGDLTKGLNGTGRIIALSHEGRILYQTFSWHPCSGGLSIADTDNDGEFELYMGDRYMYYTTDSGYGKGIRSFWAKNLTERWNHPDVLASSHIPMLADVNKDGLLDVIAVYQRGGIIVLNSTDGSAIKKQLTIYGSDGMLLPGHYQPSVYDIDGDGNLELLMADGEHDFTSNDVVVWDLVEWKEDGRMNVGQVLYGPQIADVTGDNVMDIIAVNYTGVFVFDKTYSLVAQVTGLSRRLNYAVVQDIDGDGYNEVVISSSWRRIYAFDTPSRRPTLRARSEVQFYSERRLGVAEYVPPPGSLAPIISVPSPPDGAINVPIALSQISFTLSDFQYDLMNYTVVTIPNIGSNSAFNVRNGIYTVVVNNLEYGTTYTWKVNVTDGKHWTNKTFTFTTEAKSPWWNANWKYRKTITIDPDKVNADQTSFSILINLTDSNLTGKAKLDGDDFVFIDANQNKLNHEIERYNSTTGHLIAWVNVPLLSSTTYTKLYMYYGNPNATNQQNPVAVWDSNHKMVLHLGEQNGLHYDSTINGNNGMPYGGIAQGITGKIDGADSFDGLNDYVKVPHSNSITGFTTAFTASFWVKLEDTTRRQTILNKYNTAGNQRAWFIEFKTHATYGKVLGFFISQDGATFVEYHASFNPTAGEWYYITVVWEQGKVPKFYVNGQQASTIGAATVSSVFNNSGAPLDIGRSSYATGRYLKGGLDEIRISNIARSSGWILTSYNNQENPSNFYNIGSQETLPEAPKLTFPSPFNGATNVPASLLLLSFQIKDYQGDLMDYTVTTYPDIGSGNAINVGNGRYTVSISGLSRSTTYIWLVNVSDGTNWTNKTYTFATESGSYWWSTNWPYRKTITIDPAKVSSSQTGFPVLIELTEIDLANKAQSDGDDIVFTDSNNIQLSHEIEHYNGTSGHLVAWVNIPFISSTTYTKVYMYYGNPNAPNQQNPVAVWNLSFKMVLHLDEKTGMHYDSTINGNNGMPYGGIAQGITGKIDGADSFDGLNDYVKVPHSNSITGFTTAFTASFWVKLEDTTRRQTILNKYNTAGNQRGWFIEYHVYKGRAWFPSFFASADGVNYIQWYAAFTPIVNSWYYVTVVWHANAIPKFYINGQLVPTIGRGTISQIFNNPGAPLHIGKSTYASGRELKGNIDEIRISNIARSSGWILTSYNNQENPSNFYNIGSQETLPEGLVVSVPSPSNSATRVPFPLNQLSFNLINYQSKMMNYTVITSPDIGSGSGANVLDGRYSVIVSNLAPSTTYNWIVSATDGTNWKNQTYTFTTFPGASPTQDTPLLISSEGTNKTDENLISYNQTTYDPDNDKVTNIYNWYRNNTSITNLLLPFDTNSSTIAKDYSGNGNDGIIVRDVTWINNGQVGGAYEFNRGYIKIAGASTLDGGGKWSEITVEHWIYLKSYRSGTRTIAKIPSYEIGISWNKIFAGIWIDTGIWNVSGYNRVMYNTPLEKNTWYHIAFTYKNGTGLTLYINGIAVANTPVSGNIQTSGTEPVYLGWFDYFKGIIDEVRIYPKSLSPQQVYQRYLETKSGLTDSSTIVSEETEVGDVWKCQVTPSDSYQDGAAKFSNPITIAFNDKPTAENVTINPATPYTNDDLVANYNYYDPEGIPENGTEVRWYKNGILQPELNDTLIVSYDLTTKGDIIYFTVRPSDGKEYGTIQTSQLVLIQNSPPTIDSFTPEDTTLEINEGENLEFTHTSTDLDNDILTYSWILDGVKQSNAQNWTYTPSYDAAGTHNVILRVSDMELTASQQWIITVNNVNRPPTINSYSPLTDPTIYEGESQEFNITCSDLDGDILTIEWWVNGTLRGAGNSYAFSATEAGTYIIIVIVKDGETQTLHQWTLTVKPEI